MKIRLLALRGCAKCQKMKQTFDSLKLIYNSANCEDDPSNCDSVESIVETSNYPIVILEKNGEMLEIIYLSDSYEKLSEGKKEVSNIITVPQYSIDNIANYVKNRLNLKP
jgi:glutaredoxin